MIFYKNNKRGVIMINKRGSAWIWILVVIILIAVGIGLYIWLSGGDTSPAVNAGTNAGASSGGALPQPPALPSG